MPYETAVTGPEETAVPERLREIEREVGVIETVHVEDMKGDDSEEGDDSQSNNMPENTTSVEPSGPARSSHVMDWEAEAEEWQVRAERTSSASGDASTDL